MVRFLVVEPTHQGLSPRLGIGALIFLIYFRLSGNVRSVGGDIPVEYEAFVITSSISRCDVGLISER